MNARLILVGLLIVSVCGCIHMEKIPLELKFVAHQERKCIVPNGIHRVAIMGLQNLTEEKVVSEKISGLLSSEILKTNKYSLIERMQLEKVMKELALGMSGVIRDDQIQQVGNLLGAQAIIVGEVTNYVHKVEHIPYEYESKGAGILPLPPEEETDIIVPSEKHRYMIEKYSCAVGFNLRMIDVETARIIWAKEISRSFSCREGEYDIHSVDYIMDKLVKASIEEAVWELQ